MIVISNTKGGVGKSTTTTHLAVQITSAGDGPVCLMDLDRQGSTVAWWNTRTAEDIAFSQIDLEKLGPQIVGLEERGIRYLIIDTPPLVVDSVAKVMAVADLIMVPIGPSPVDLKAVGPTIEMCNRVGKRPLFVINGALQRTRVTTETVALLSQFGAVSPAVLHMRNSYATSMGHGLTLQESSPKDKGVEEVGMLWAHAKQILEPVEQPRTKKVIA